MSQFLRDFLPTLSDLPTYSLTCMYTTVLINDVFFLHTCSESIVDYGIPFGHLQLDLLLFMCLTECLIMCLSKQNGLGCNLLTSAMITCCHLNLCDLEDRSCSELAVFISIRYFGHLFTFQILSVLEMADVLLHFFLLGGGGRVVWCILTRKSISSSIKLLLI